MIRALLTAAVVAAVAYGVREERVLERSELLGSCSELATTVSTDVQWLGCNAGRLTGYPDLSRNGCFRAPARGALELWRCPATLVASPSVEASAP